MNRKIVLLGAIAASMIATTPALAGGWNSKPKPKPPVSSTSGGHQVPEPGMLGLMGVGLVGLGVARSRRKARKTND